MDYKSERTRFGSSGEAPYVFKARDDEFLSSIKSDLTVNPQLTQEIRRLVNINFRTVGSETLAIRPDDLLNFLADLTHFRLPAHRTYNTFPLPKFERDHQDIDSTVSVYDSSLACAAKTRAFASAFVKSVSPYLITDWAIKSRHILDSDAYTEKSLGLSDEEVIHNLAINLLEDFHNLERNHLSLQSALQKVNFGYYPYLNKFMQLVRENVAPIGLLTYLEQVSRERDGVIVGLNSHFFAQKMNIEKTSEMGSGEVAFDYREIAVWGTRNQRIILSPGLITSIEPLGEWEERVLKELFAL